MNSPSKKRLATAFLLVCLPRLAAAQPFYLQPRDRVVFYGDSITYQRLYTVIAELYTVTRYPNLNVNFVASGWINDRVTGGPGGPIDVRLNRDVIAYHPSVVTILLGMNDGMFANHKAEDDQVFQNGYGHIVEKLRTALPSVRITLLQPSAFDDVTRPFTLQPGGYNSILVRYGDWLRSYTKQENLTVADFNTDLVSLIRRLNAFNPEAAKQIIPDRIHPLMAGQLILAEQLLKAWDARPLVSSVTIDARGGRIADSQYVAIRGFRPGKAIEWTELEDSLPLPFAALSADPIVRLAIENSDVTEALNLEVLKIENLQTGRYRLTIDSDRVGLWDDRQLAQGVNLALLDTPMARQAEEVRALAILHNRIHLVRWRTLQLARSSRSGMALADSLESLVVFRERAAAQPKPHAFRLVPAT